MIKYEQEFLTALFENNNHTTYANIEQLSKSGEPINSFQGKVTQGSVNIDGGSAVRRSCSLTFVTNELNTTVDYKWNFNTNFRLSIGLENMVSTSSFYPSYPSIIWFPLGVYVITNFQTASSTNNFTITIQGKDKMSLLNGDLGGNLFAKHNFGTYEDADGVVRKNTIQSIIKELVHAYGHEPYHNIIIRDVAKLGQQILEYRNEEPMYLIRQVVDDEYEQVYFGDDDNRIFYINNNEKMIPTTLKDIPVYEKRISTLSGEIEEPTKIYKGEWQSSKMEYDLKHPYYCCKIEYGDTAGYRSTELTYPGDLIANAGETVVSVLDKIKKMLGNFEYFYNLEGQFVFQRQRSYINTQWTPLVTDGNGETYVENYNLASLTKYDFINHKLLTSFNNNPNINNIKNDFAVQGSKSSSNGGNIPIHMRYAIDKKPLVYYSFAREDDDFKYDYICYVSDLVEDHSVVQPNSYIDFYLSGIEKKVDWREIIYQMATDFQNHNNEDDFEYELAKRNEPYYQQGKTGYEQYYADILGFWRNLYNPDNKGDYTPREGGYDFDDSKHGYNNIYLKEYFCPITLGNWPEKNTTPSEYGFLPTNFGDYYCLDQSGILRKCVDLFNFTDATSNSMYIKRGQGNATYYEQVLNKIISNEEDEANLTEEQKIYNSKLFDLTPQEKGNLYLYIKDTKKYEPWVKYNTETQKWELNEHFSNLEEDSVKTIWNKFIEGKLLYYYNTNNKKVVSLYDIFTFPQDENFPIARIYNPFNSNKLSVGYEYAHSDNAGILTNDTSYLTFEYYDYKDTFNHNSINTKYRYWNIDVFEKPENLIFWIDFLDTNGELGDYSIQNIGDRTKVVNDTNVKSIYYRSIPKIIFESRTHEVLLNDKLNGYKYFYIPESYDVMFSVSSQGLSAKNKIDEILYQATCEQDSVTINSIPIYYLDVNTQIYIYDENSGINHNYAISKLTMPLTHNGTMSITATKIPENSVYEREE